MSMLDHDTIRDALLGLIVGDALGVPAEGRTRSSLRIKPITDMVEYYMPMGTWSDDSSLVLATMDSLIERRSVDYNNIMHKFSLWRYEGEYTPDGVCFGCGRATARTVRRFDGSNALQCGGQEKSDNGNGSLMRILPVSLYQYAAFNGLNHNNRPGVLTPIHSASAITHAHPISMMGCSLYTGFVAAIINTKCDEKNCTIISALQASVITLQNDYKNQYGNLFNEECYFDSFIEYRRLLDIAAFKDLNEAEIESGGYVVYTLEAALWCFLNSDSYEECVLKAVNLGGDTDTTAAVAGGLAGAYYGAKNIPEKWINAIRKLNWIENRIFNYSETLNNI